MKLVDEIEKEIGKSNNFDDKSWMLIYAHDKVILQNFDLNSQDIINLNLDDIKEARIFNKNDELKIWNYQGNTKNRLFSETKKDDCQEYDETMLLQDCFKSKENKIKVKNYYKYDDNGLILFYDAKLTEVI